LPDSDCLHLSPHDEIKIFLQRERVLMGNCQDMWMEGEKSDAGGGARMAAARSDLLNEMTL